MTQAARPDQLCTKYKRVPSRANYCFQYCIYCTVLIAAGEQIRVSTTTQPFKMLAYISCLASASALPAMSLILLNVLSITGAITLKENFLLGKSTINGMELRVAAYNVSHSSDESC